MAAVTLQVICYRLARKPIGRELQLTFWASMVFGGLTLFYRDEAFIQWKPTIINWLLAASLVTSHFMRKNLIQKLLGSKMHLPDQVWVNLNLGWSAGFFLAGALNLVVAYNFSMEVWVTYKLVGGLALTFTYVILTTLYLHKLGLLDAVADPPGAASVTGADAASVTEPKEQARAMGGGNVEEHR
jgi:intracellular septation protein